MAWWSEDPENLAPEISKLSLFLALSKAWVVSFPLHSVEYTDSSNKLQF